MLKETIIGFIFLFVIGTIIDLIFDTSVSYIIIAIYILAFIGFMYGKGGTDRFDERYQGDKDKFDRAMRS